MIARLVTYVVLATLGIFVLTTTFLIDRGGGSATPDDDGVVSVHDLSTNPESYRGQTVTTIGTLGFSTETAEWQLVDEDVAVVIKDYELEALQSLTGQEVSVTGTFDFEDDTGIFIDVEVIVVQD